VNEEDIQTICNVIRLAIENGTAVAQRLADRP
jgi:hypothetical protein